MVAPCCPCIRHVQRVRKEPCLHLPIKIAYRTPSIRERSDSRKKRPPDEELGNRKDVVTAGKLDQAIVGGAPDMRNRHQISDSICKRCDVGPGYLLYCFAPIINDDNGAMSK